MNRAVTSIKLSPVEFCREQTSFFLRKYPNFYEYNMDVLLPETFLALAEGLKKYDEKKGSKILPFLKKRIEYRLLDYIRKQGKQILNDTDVEVKSQTPVLNGRVDVELIMKQLEDNELQVYRLYFVKSCTLKDIADAMNLSTSRVHQILDAVKKKVKVLLDDGNCIRPKKDTAQV